MDILTAALNWLLIHTIYGIVGVAAVTYWIFNIAKKRIPQLPKPEYIAVLIFLVGIFTVPSIPRYQFEKKVLSTIEGKDWIRIVNETHSGDLTEPLTWVKAPMTSLTILMPNNIVDGGGFRQISFRYGERESVLMVSPECDHLTISYSQPDDNGVLRYIRFGEDMSDGEKRLYCEYDWSKEESAAHKETLRLLKATGK